MAIITSEYKNWIGELKQRIRQSQIKAAVRVNTELLQLLIRNTIQLRHSLCRNWGMRIANNLLAKLALQLGNENRAQVVPQLAETYRQLKKLRPK